MLKRQQILMDHWLNDPLKRLAKALNLSYSETIRALLCLQICSSISKVYPKYPIPNFDRELKRMRKRFNIKNDSDKVKIKKFLSKLYFETRKAIEFSETRADIQDIFDKI